MPVSAIMPPGAPRPGAGRGTVRGGRSGRGRAAGRSRPHPEHVARGHRLESLDDLVHGKDLGSRLAPVPRHAATALDHSSRSSIRPRVYALARSTSTLRNRILDHSIELLEGGADDGRRLRRVEPGMDAHRPAVGVGRGKGADVVRQRPSLAELEEQPAAHPVPEDRGEQVECPAVGMGARHARHAEAQVPLRQPPEPDPHRARRGRRRRREAGPLAPARWLAAARREPRPRGAAHRRWLDRAGHRQDHVLGAVPPPPVPLDGSMGVRPHGPGVPAISRPSGWAPNRSSSNSEKTWSEGESTYARISSTTTGFSATRSAGRRSGCSTSSDTTSKARSARLRGTRAE